MSDPDRLSRFLRTKLRGAGRQYAEARRAFQEARTEAVAELPTDDSGRARLVCRRFAEQRAVEVDAEARPACFEADHPDCEGCVEDIRDGCVETW
jgi:hypothetical protein